MYYYTLLPPRKLTTLDLLPASSTSWTFKWFLEPFRIGLSLFRGDRLDLGREPRMRHRIHQPVLHLGVRRIFSKKVVTVPVPRRSNRSRDKPAAAIWTDISQNASDGRIAEGALVRTYARLKRIGRQRLIAVLAGRSEFKHGVLNVKLPIMCDQ